MIDFSKVSDPTDIVNYIIPKGTAEGVNQLTIASVNSGLKYVKDDVSISLWGKRSYIWIDKSIESAQTLKDNALLLLSQWKDLKISFSVNSADLSILPEYSQEQKILNGITRIIVDNETYYARIIGEEMLFQHHLKLKLMEARFQVLLYQKTDLIFYRT
jgi:phage minor structural protein